MYKEDLQEFTTSLASDTKQAINKSGEFIQKVAKETAEPADISEEASEDPLTHSAAKTDESIRKMTEKLSSDIQNSISSFFGEYLPGSVAVSEETAKEVAVFLSDPSDTDKYNEWGKQKFILEDHTEDISHLLNADSFLRQVHTQLVPSKVTSNDFWRRYYYSVFEADEKERKRAAILARAQAAIVEDEEEDIGWSDNEDDEEESPIESAPVEIESTLEHSSIPNDPGAGSPPSYEFFMPNGPEADLDGDIDDLLNDMDLVDVEPDMALEEIEFDDDYDDWE